MKGSQGLEALAALCGGQSDAPTQNARAASAGAQGRNSTVAGTSRNPAHQTQQPQNAEESPLTTAQRQNPLSSQQSSLSSLAQQQWQQAIAAASGLPGSGVSPSLAAQSLLLSGLAPQGLGDPSISTMQQLALHQYMQTQAKLSAAQQAAAAQSLGVFGDTSQQALLMALAGKAQHLHPTRGHELAGVTSKMQQQVIPSVSNAPSSINSINRNGKETSSTTSSAPASAASPAPVGSPGSTSMKPPPPPSSQSVQSTSSSLSTAGILGQGKAHRTIAPMPGGKILPNSDSVGGAVSTDDKKQQKRAANRRSAQLSRKRKKQFIEELKEENDELRRKEQILRSIPDLIVVFDSSGKLGFVSQSVSRFLDISSEDLEGTSFWDRLCEDSVRLLKAAFMDSLAARKADSDTAPLGSGVWELRLINKDSNHIIVTLNGVVHFSGEAPECVCCIRPRDQLPIQKLPKERKTKATKTTSRTVSSSDGSRTSDDSTKEEQHPQIRVDPSQSVISNDNSGEDNSAEGDSSPQEDEGNARKKARRDDEGRAADDRIVRISDGDSGCEVSESSGSDDGIASS